MFSKRHYTVIAEVLKQNFISAEESVDAMVAEGTVIDAAQGLAKVFAEDNDEFDRERFFAACGVKEKLDKYPYLRRE